VIFKQQLAIGQANVNVAIYFYLAHTKNITLQLTTDSGM